MWRYLKGPQNKIENHPNLVVDVVRDEGKNDVIYAKKRYQQQSGFSQSPEKSHKTKNRGNEKEKAWVPPCENLSSYTQRRAFHYAGGVIAQHLQHSGRRRMYSMSPDKKWLW